MKEQRKRAWEVLAGFAQQDGSRLSDADWLLSCIRRNADTAFGREHGFSDIATIQEYRERVPVRSYDEISSYIERVAQGEVDVLFPGQPVAFEQTSGSTGARKLIPYTEESFQDFRACLLPWLGGLVRRYGLCGSLYWSISPAVSAPAPSLPCGIPVGVPDAQYIGAGAAEAVAALSAVPFWAGSLGNVAEWRLVTLYYLLRAHDLCFLSIWSPTFFLALLDSLDALDTLDDQGGSDSSGTLGVPNAPDSRDTSDALRRSRKPNAPDTPGPLGVSKVVYVPNTPDIEGAAESGQSALLRLLKYGGTVAGHALEADPSAASRLERYLEEQSKDTRILWPNLTLVSAWADASAAPYYAALQARLPQAAFEAKGLLATEGVVSVPGKSGIPLVPQGCGFIEYMDDEGRCFLPNELQPDDLQSEALQTKKRGMGGSYRTVITTSGGLYRYLTGDSVICTGFENGRPLLRFTGRHGRVSDLTGEKVSDAFVSACFSDLRCFAQLIPLPDGANVAIDGRFLGRPSIRSSDVESDISASCAGTPGYLLVLGSAENAQATCRAIEQKLCANPHYAWSRSSGQLAPLCWAVVPDALERSLQAGAGKLAVVKLPALDVDGTWALHWQNILAIPEEAPEDAPDCDAPGCDNPGCAVQEAR